MDSRSTSRIGLGIVLAGVATLALAAAQAAPDRPRPQRPRDYTLHLGGVSFDPAAVAPAVTAPAGWSEVDAEGPDLRLVQLAGPIRGAWVTDLQAAGLEIVQYIHPYTYIVWGDPLALEATTDAAAVRWVGDFLPAFRVLPRWRDLPDEAVESRVLMYRGADTDAAVETIAGLGGAITGRRVLNDVFEIAGVRVSGARFRDMAHIPGVYSIQTTPTDGGLRGEMSDQINAGNYDASNRAFPGYPAWLDGLGLHGDGVVIANVDGGIQDTHPDLVSRLVPCTGPTCGGGASSNHGTHTAAIMAADGASGTVDQFGFLRGLGVAPGANLVEQVYSPWFTQPGGMLLLMTDSYASGASLSGNSWGPSGSPRGYDDDTMQVDIGVRDTDPNTPGDQPLTFVLSFMNGNGGTSTQGTPDEAKNLFNIGSTKMQDGSGAQILDINDLSGNTAHGPALDGRTIPHLVAPGCEVDSALSSGYGLLCGTSMASPHVSGAVALFIEHYRGLPNYAQDPSPALIKAAFLPVAHDLAGFRDADGGILGHPFDSKQGWGRLNLPAVIDPPPDGVRYFDVPAVFDDTGEEWSIELSPLDPAEPMKVMLVWTDAPGHGLGGSTPAWNNDLDLVVEAGGNTYFGNVFGPNGWSVTGGAADDRNNTEGVFLGPAPPAVATIRVVASNINSNGLPNSGDLTDQDFALVVYNAAEEPGFALTPTPGRRAVCAPAQASYEIALSQILGFTEPVTLSAAGAPAGTVVTFSANPVVPPGTSTMTVTETASAAAGSYAIDVTGTAPTLTRDITVHLDLFTAIPTAPALTSPPDGAIDVARMPTLVWEPAAQASVYDLEVATDAGFATVVYQANVNGTEHTVGISLDTVTQHWWRVRASNTCGLGPDSVVYTFTTLDQPDYQTEHFDTSGNDLDNFGVRFIPDGSGDFYERCGDDATQLPTDPTGGMVLPLSDDDFEVLTPSQPVSLYGVAYGTIYVGSNGYLTFTGGDTDFTESLEDHFDTPRISGLFDDLNPSAGGVVSWKELPDRVAVTYQDVPEFSNTGANTFQIEMFFTGEIRVTWLAIGAVDGLAGLSEGGGLPNDFVESDVSASPPCNAPCPADVNGDRVVDVLDLLAVLAAWGPCPGCPEDINGDGAVNVLDLLELLAAWGACP